MKTSHPSAATKHQVPQGTWQQTADCVSELR